MQFKFIIAKRQEREVIHKFFLVLLWALCALSSIQLLYFGHSTFSSAAGDLMVSINAPGS